MKPLHSLEEGNTNQALISTTRRGNFGKVIWATKSRLLLSISQGLDQSILVSAPLFGQLPQLHFPSRELHPRLGRETQRAEQLYSPGKWLSQTEALHLPQWSEQNSSGSSPAAGHLGSADRLYWTKPVNKERQGLHYHFCLRPTRYTACSKTICSCEHLQPRQGRRTSPTPLCICLLCWGLWWYLLSRVSSSIVTKWLGKAFKQC